MTPPRDRKRRGGAARRPKVEKIKRSGWWRKAGVACCICCNYHSAAASTDAPPASATVHTGLESPDLKVMQVSVVPARLNDLQQVQHEMSSLVRQPAARQLVPRVLISHRPPSAIWAPHTRRVHCITGMVLFLNARVLYALSVPLIVVVCHLHSSARQRRKHMHSSTRMAISDVFVPA